MYEPHISCALQAIVPVRFTKVPASLAPADYLTTKITVDQFEPGGLLVALQLNVSAETLDPDFCASVAHHLF